MPIKNNYFDVMYRGGCGELFHKNYAKWFAREYLTKDMKILELGNGKGYLTRALKERGYDIVGYDYPEIDLEKELNIRSNYFDVVICRSAIEHLKNIFTIVEETKRMLKDGGIAIFTTGDVSRQGYAWYEDPTHHTVFTPARLKNLFLFNGFKVIRLKHYGNIPFIWRYTWRAFDYCWFNAKSFVGVFENTKEVQDE